MRIILTLSILVTVFAFSTAEYPELNEDGLTELERVRKFTRQMANENTKFWLCTKARKEVDQGRRLIINDTHLLRRAEFDALLPVRFLIHGFLNKKNSPFNELITKAYLTYHTVNVIVVDWGALSETAITAPKYFDVAESIKHVAELVAQMAKFLKDQGVPYEKMYLIGHSLGAHISGMAGQKLDGDNKFGVIFGLDPAGPKFKDVPLKDRLDEDDASYVETIQTDVAAAGNWTFEFIRKVADKLLTFGYGGTLGKASFFPNYGHMQPGCEGKFGCSHSRAYEYFAESLDNIHTFNGRKCGSYEEVKEQNCRGTENAKMGGEPAHTENRGIFYVEVDKEPPYSEFGRKKSGISKSWWQRAGDYVKSWTGG